MLAVIRSLGGWGGGSASGLVLLAGASGLLENPLPRIDSRRKNRIPGESSPRCIRRNHSYGAAMTAVATFESVLSLPLEFTAVTW
jgi:hypothetical protein